MNAGIERAHVMGLSMGGMIVQTLAIEHPDRLLSMTSMMSTTGDLDVGNPTEDALRLILAPPPTDRDTYIARHLEQLRTWGSPAYYDEARSTANAAAAYRPLLLPRRSGPPVGGDHRHQQPDGGVARRAGARAGDPR